MKSTVPEDPGLTGPELMQLAGHLKTNNTNGHGTQPYSPRALQGAVHVGVLKLRVQKLP